MGFETDNDPHDEHSEGSFSSFSVHLSMGSKASPLFAPQSDFSTQEQPSSPGNSTLHEQPFTSSFDNSSAKEDMTEERHKLYFELFFVFVNSFIFEINLDIILHSISYDVVKSKDHVESL